MNTKMRNAVAGLACHARAAAMLMVRPAATGFVENRVFFQEGYEALVDAIETYEEALEIPEITESALNSQLGGTADAFRCECERSQLDALGICRACGGFGDAC